MVCRMPLHPQAAAFLEALKGPGGDDIDVQAMREASRAGTDGETRIELAAVADSEVTGPGEASIPVRTYRPRSGRLPAIVYFHGGGWVIGGIESVDALCRELAVRVGCVVVSVDYRLAPEHPFPAAVTDCHAVTRDVLQHPDRYGIDPGRVGVAGDSAGGNLAAVVAGLARTDGIPLAHQLLICPNTDTHFDTPSFHAFGDGYGLTADGMIWFFKRYGGGADPDDPRLAPLRAPHFRGLAPATVITAEYDILRDEGEAYGAALAAAGVPVGVRRFDGMIHNFFQFPLAFDTAVDARTWAFERLRAGLTV
jgi:acetyl esterase